MVRLTKLLGWTFAELAEVGKHVLRVGLDESTLWMMMPYLPPGFGFLQHLSEMRLPWTVRVSVRPNRP